MAITSNPLIGATKQKMGGAVFTTWKGKYVLKTKPLTVHNPQSDLQKTQRNKLAAIVAVFRLISGAIMLGFKQLAIGMSEYNAFSSYNILNATTVSTPTNVTVDPTKLRVSDGSLGSTTPLTVTVDVSDSNVVVTYPTDTPLSSQKATDIAHAVLHNATENTWEYLGSNSTRAAGTATFVTTLELTVSDSCFVYVFFVSPDGTKSSVSTISTANAQA